jgi:hypothetical protein
MAKPKKLYDVWFEVVNLRTRTLEKRLLQTGLDYKSALAVKRRHKNVCAMHIALSGTVAIAPIAANGAE